MKKAGRGINICSRKKKAQAKAQTESVWLGRPREGFTAQMADHFNGENDPENKMMGITMMAAKRNGTLS